MSRYLDGYCKVTRFPIDLDTRNVGEKCVVLLITVGVAVAYRRDGMSLSELLDFLLRRVYAVSSVGEC